jgi:iron complex outermembrane receptor protein
MSATSWKVFILGCSMLVVPGTSAAAAAAGAEAAANAGSTIEELVVTATRREERLQDVPIAVTALSAKQLENQGVTSAQDLTRVSPGLIYTTTGPNAMPTMRGVGTRSFSPGDSAPIAVYIDNVYLPAEGAGEFEFGDVERVEILKGPQGTLFGRNATGGAINVITRSPSTTPEFRGEVGVGSYGRRLANTYINAPLASNVNANLSAFYDEDDGFTRNLVTGRKIPFKDDWGVRGKVDIRVTPILSFLLEADWVRANTPQGYANEQYPGGTNRNVVANPTKVFTTSEFGKDYSNLDPKGENRQWGGSVTGNLDMTSWTLKSITADRATVTRGLLDTDGTSADITKQYLRTTNNTFTQEFLASSTGDHFFNWVGGVFYMFDDAKRDPNYSYTSPLVFATTFADIKTTAIAPYGEVTIKPTEHWSLIGGMRYSYERKHLFNSSGPNGCLIPSCTIPRVDSKHSWRSFDYRLTVQYKVDESLNFYATNSTGFKSGAYNSTGFDGIPVNPEHLTAYQIGMKSTRWDTFLDINAFYYLDKGIQIQRSTNPLTGTSVLQNAAGAHDYGIEVSAVRPLGDHFSVNLGATWLHARYSDFKNADVLIPRAVALGGGKIETAEDDTGNPVIRSPEFTANADLTYSTEAWGGHINAALGGYYTSTYSFEPGNRVRQPAYGTLHAQVAWTSPNNRYTFTVFGDNITNTHYYEIGSSSIVWYNIVYAQPAIFGVKASVHY